MDALGIFRPLQFPGIAVAQPVVRLLDLLAVFDVLAEHAVFVADAIAHHRQLQRGATVQKTGGQPAQAAVAEPGIVLLVGQLFQHAGRARAAPRSVASSTPRLSMRIAQRPAHQEFQRQVIGALAVLFLIGVVGILPALHQAVAQRQRERGVNTVAAGHLVPSQGVAEIAAEIVDDAVGVHAQSRQLGNPGTGLLMISGSV